MTYEQDAEWHDCPTNDGVTVVRAGKQWRLADREYEYPTFQSGTSIAITFCPFCGLRLGTPERIIGPGGQTFTVTSGWQLRANGEET